MRQVKARIFRCAAVLGLTLSSPALAEAPAPVAADADLSAQAMQLYNEGLRAAKAGQWDKARTFYLSAFRVQQHVQIAANLGRAEFRTGKLKDAAEHLSYFLLQAKSIEPSDRKVTEELLAQAKEKIGTLTITVSQDGAEIRIDGTEFGPSPLRRELFVEPGQHWVEAKLQGFTRALAIKEVEAGGEAHVDLNLTRKAPPEADLARTSGLPPLRAQDKSGLNKPILIGGSIATGLALGLGVVSTILSIKNAALADEKRDVLRRAQGDNACGAAPMSEGCKELHALRVDRALFGNMAVWSFLSAGALGAATAGITIASSKQTAEKAGARVLPIIELGALGVSVRGAW